MCSKQKTNYANMPTEELVAKIERLIKLNYTALHGSKKINRNFNKIAQMILNTKIIPSNNYDYDNIMSILSNPSDDDRMSGIISKYNDETTHIAIKVNNYVRTINKLCEQAERYKIKYGNNEDSLARYTEMMTLIAKMKRDVAEINAELETRKTRDQYGIILDNLYIYDHVQPDDFNCTPKNYDKMISSLEKVGNPRITNFVKWYATADSSDQSKYFVDKYDEYFESLDDHITLHEIMLHIIHVDGLVTM